VKKYHAGEPTVLFAATEKEALYYIEDLGNKDNAKWIANWRPDGIGKGERVQVILAPGWDANLDNVSAVKYLYDTGAAWGFWSFDYDKPSHVENFS
jgi:hypothetical protein